jgi:acetyltransferase-like isoleucine patch superfamily enzyme
MSVWLLIDKVVGRVSRYYHKRVFMVQMSTRASDCTVLGKVHVFGNPRIEIGRNVRIWPGVSFAGDGTIVIGDDVAIGKDANLYASKGGGVRIGDDVAIGAQCYVIDSNHGTAKRDLIRNQALECREVVIGDDVWIAAQCAVIKGARICDGAVIGAGAVVNSIIPAYCVAAGIPARVVGERGDLTGVPTRR